MREGGRGIVMHQMQLSRIYLIDLASSSPQTGGHDASFHRGVRRGSKALFQDRFDVGGFYSTMDIPEGPVLTMS